MIQGRHIKLFLLVILVAGSALVAMAQTPPPGGGNDPEAAFDLISGILVLAGVAYGSSKMIGREKS